MYDVTKVNQGHCAIRSLFVFFFVSFLFYIPAQKRLKIFGIINCYCFGLSFCRNSLLVGLLLLCYFGLKFFGILYNKDLSLEIRSLISKFLVFISCLKVFCGAQETSSNGILILYQLFNSIRFDFNRISLIVNRISILVRYYFAYSF